MTRRPKAHRTFLVIATVTFLTAGSAAQPRLSQDAIPGSISAEVRDLATRLYDNDAMRRADSACEIGNLGSRAEPLAPLLVSLLGDNASTPVPDCWLDRRRGWERRGGAFGDWPPTTPGREAARALVNIGRRTAPALLEALSDEAWVVRMNAAWAVGRLDDNRAVEPLIQLLDDRERDVQIAAAGALGRLDDSRAVSPLLESLDDSEVEVRSAAAWALGRLDDGRAVDGLIDALEDAAQDVRAQAA